MVISRGVFFCMVLMAFIAHATPAQTVQPSHSMSSYHTVFEQDMKALETALRQQKIVHGLRMVSKIQTTLYTLQHHVFASYFPSSNREWLIQDDSESHDYVLENTQYGVLFSQRYKTASGQQLDITVVTAEEESKDYRELVANAQLLASMPHAQTVTIQGYKGIQKYVAANQQYEHIFVMNADFLLIAVGGGLRDAAQLHGFMNRVSFSALETYLKDHY